MFRKKNKIDYWYAASILRNRIPELKEIDSEKLKHCLMTTRPQMEYYEVAAKPVKFWVRLTLPFAIIAALLMIVFMPFTFIFTGQWGYSDKFGYNWFKSLKLT
jgi:hypothetical protein